MSISAIYQKGMIKPLVNPGLEEFEEIEIEVKRKNIFEKFHGKLKLITTPSSCDPPVSCVYAQALT